MRRILFSRFFSPKHHSFLSIIPSLVIATLHEMCFAPTRSFRAFSIFFLSFFRPFFFPGKRGEQERDAATEAIKRAAPNATVLQIRTSGYPCYVRVSSVKEATKEAPRDLLWESEQRNLFSKYPERRKQSMAAIEAVVKKLLA